jgi:6-phosphofructokinase 1
MDNDILWVWQSFGFDTAVEQATRVINTLRSEAEATRRIGLIQLFGAESGYVAANAALASGHVDGVLIPEVIKALRRQEAESYLLNIVQHVENKIRNDRKHNPHGLMVISEGVGTYLEKLGACIGGTRVTKANLIGQLTNLVKEHVHDARGDKVSVFENEPRHYVRSVPANPHDQIYCERLGALAVDNALAGFTDCMISQWLTEYVLVPLRMVIAGQKSIPVNGMFWKQVVSTTGQPLSPAEHVTPSGSDRVSGSHGRAALAYPVKRAKPSPRSESHKRKKAKR